jgi:hypothetical protein
MTSQNRSRVGRARPLRRLAFVLPLLLLCQCARGFHHLTLAEREIRVLSADTSSSLQLAARCQKVAEEDMPASLVRLHALELGAGVVVDLTRRGVQFTRQPERLTVKTKVRAGKCTTYHFSNAGMPKGSRTFCEDDLVEFTLDQTVFKTSCDPGTNRCSTVYLAPVDPNLRSRLILTLAAECEGDYASGSMTCLYGSARPVEKLKIPGHRTSSFWKCPEAAIADFDKDPPGEDWQSAPERIELVGHVDRPVLGVDLSTAFSVESGGDLDSFGGGIIFAPFNHVALELPASFVLYHREVGNHPFDKIAARGYAFAPALQLQFSSEPGHTFFLAAGLRYMHLASSEKSGNAWGFVAGAGYEWRFQYGLGLLLSGEIERMQRIDLSGTEEASAGGGLGVGLNVGLRYMLL